MSSIRIGCLSYVPIGYAVPQIPWLMQSLHRHYQPDEPIQIYEPEWGGFDEQPDRFPEFSLFRYNRGMPTGREHYRDAAEWLGVHRFDVLVITHFKYLEPLIRTGIRPRFVIYYNFENPCDDEQPNSADFEALGQIEKWVDLVLFTEVNRQEHFYQTCGGRDIPWSLLYNAPPRDSCPFVPPGERNGRLILQGTIDFRRTYIDYLCRIERPPLPCDIYGSLHGGNAAVVIADEQAQRQFNLRYQGLVTNDELSHRRAHYSYSLVMWKPLTPNYYFACPNKFFESIASGVPPLVAPHPQCAEICDRFDLGIKLADWSFEAFCRASQLALDSFTDGRFAFMVARCREAHREELNWEHQFDRLTRYLPTRPANPAPAKHPRFLLVDPSLRDRVGHHYVYGQGCLLAARLEGLRTVALVNRMLITRLDGVDQLIPVFRRDFWGRKLTHTGFDPSSPRVSDFAAQLRRSLEPLALGHADHVFIPNISDDDLEALAGLLEASGSLRRAMWHVFIRHDLPGEDSPPSWLARPLVSRLGRLRRRKLQSARLRAIDRLSRVLGPRLHLCTDTEPLAVQHEWYSGRPFTVLPIPAALESPGFAPTTDLHSDVDSLCIVYAGDARAEKGFLSLPHLLSSCRDLLAAGSLRFRIQTHHPHGDTAILQAKQELAALNLPNVELLDEMLSDAAYAELMQSAKVLLVTYDPAAYRRRSSHVFIEALANGRIPIVCRGSWMAGCLPADCPWVVPDADHAHLALRAIAEDPARHQSLLDQLSAEARGFHTARKLVQMLVARSAND
jgi:hypothetical protein